MDAKLPEISVAEHLVARIATLDAGKLPAAVRAKCEELLIDVVGLCLTARNEDYVLASINGWDDDGPCTAIGHKRTLSAAGAAFVNGTACHGEDFDDTFEGGPVHAGAVIVPAVLGALERHGGDGKAALLGIAVGVETMCRLSTVAPTKAHKAGFHPTAMPSSAALPSPPWRSNAFNTAGTITAPAWIGPPSNVSSKSSPWQAVPLTKAAPAALSVRLWPIAVQGPSSSQPLIEART